MKDLCGTTLGRYRIERELGRGGMSVVYLATDLRLDKQWAVKVIRREQQDAFGRLRAASLLTEAGLMKRLDHPALPRIVDVFEEEDVFILVMDYVQGESLAAIRKSRGRVEETLAREWMSRLAEVLAYLHGQDPPIIYRDMKPDNVILRPDGSLTLVDLGIAREYRESGSRDTVVLGTKGYAAPEQHGGAQTDVRTDIYGLGIAMTELVTGVPPQDDPYLYRPHPFRKICPDISEDFARILNRCIAFSPQQRYSSCAALIRDLQGTGSMRTEKEKQYGRRRFLIAAAVLILGVSVVLCGGSGTAEANAHPEAFAAAEEMIRACSAQEVMTEEDSARLLEMIDDLQPAAKQMPAEAAAVCFAAGRLYLYRYGGDGDSLRSRMVMAQPLFEKAGIFRKQASAAEGEVQRSSVSSIGEENLVVPTEKQLAGYTRLCSFFLRYVCGGTDFLEPEEKEYREILQAIEICLEEPEIGASDDGTYLTLLLYRNMAGLLNEYRQGFAAAGIPEEKVCALLMQISELTAGIYAARESLRELQETILEENDRYEEGIRQSYRNIRQWETAEKNANQTEEGKAVEGDR